MRTPPSPIMVTGAFCKTFCIRIFMRRNLFLYAEKSMRGKTQKSIDAQQKIEKALNIKAFLFGAGNGNRTRNLSLGS